MEEGLGNEIEINQITFNQQSDKRYKINITWYNKYNMKITYIFNLGWIKISRQFQICDTSWSKTNTQQIFPIFEILSNKKKINK